MQRKKTLLFISGTTMVLSAAFLTKLAMDLTNNKKKIEDLYLELAFVLSVLMLSFITTILLIKEKKYEELKRSDSNLSLLSEESNIKNDSNSKEEIKTETKEISKTVEEQPKKLERRNSSPALLNCEKVLVREIKIGKEDENIDVYYNLTDQPTKIEVFGQDDTILAITLPKKYSITKIDGDKKTQITDKKGIINHGDKYKPIDLQISEDGTFTFKYQNTQKDDVFIELTCNTLNAYSGWKDNDEKPVTKYFKDLNTKAKEAAKAIEEKKTEIKRLETVKKSEAEIEKLQKEIKKLEAIAVEANDDFLIFLNVKEVFSKSLKVFLKFCQLFAPANPQGLSIIEGKTVHKHFELGPLRNNCLNVKTVHMFEQEPSNQKSFWRKIKDMVNTININKDFPIIDILVSNQLVHKEVEVVEKVEDNTNQVPLAQTVSPSDENIATTSDSLEVKQEKIKPGVQKIVDDLVEKVVQEGISESNSSHNTVTTTEAEVDTTPKAENKLATTDTVDASANSPTKKSDQKQDKSLSSSQSFIGSKESIDSASTSKKSKSPFKKAKKLGSAVGQKTREGFSKLASKFGTKGGTKSAGASPSSSIDEIGTEAGADNQGFEHN